MLRSPGDTRCIVLPEEPPSRSAMQRGLDWSFGFPLRGNISSRPVVRLAVKTRPEIPEAISQKPGGMECWIDVAE